MLANNMKYIWLIHPIIAVNMPLTNLSGRQMLLLLGVLLGAPALFAAETATPPAEESVVSERIEAEQAAADARFALFAHKPSYILPFSWWSAPNEAPYAVIGGKSLEAQEAVFQLSLKVPVVRHVFSDKSSLWFGYTQRAWWQVYNDEGDTSRPFRETNHEPELMLDTLTDFNILGLHNRVIRVGLVHQSNGQSRPLSRSWNRAYVDFILEWHDIGLSFRPWYRLPESAAEDDNPDINDYLGYFDLTAVWRNGEHEYSLAWRRNFATDRGAVQLDYSYPLNDHIRGYVQIFHGYGESLIDYNHKATRVGIGIQIASWL